MKGYPFSRSLGLLLLSLSGIVDWLRSYPISIIKIGFSNELIKKVSPLVQDEAL